MARKMMKTFIMVTSWSPAAILWRKNYKKSCKVI